jgi:hypothetical protein
MKDLQDTGQAGSCILFILSIHVDLNTLSQRKQAGRSHAWTASPRRSMISAWKRGLYHYRLNNECRGESNFTEEVPCLISLPQILMPLPQPS